MLSNCAYPVRVRAERSVPYIPFVEHYSIRLKENTVLVLKSYALVMFLLPFDVSNNPVEI